MTDFRWVGRANSDLSFDAMGRNREWITVIDAVNFEGREGDQYLSHWIERELDKAYLGFSIQSERNIGIATGNWGCGAFKGNPQLKMLLQWAAASQCGKPLYYLTWLLPDLAQAHQIHLCLQNRRVSDLIQLLLRYNSFRFRATLFDFILSETNRLAF